MVRASCDEAWVLDLGGDNKGSNPEENVFAIETPVAIVVMVRDGAKKRSLPAQIHYRRISGTAADKRKSMADIGLSDEPLAGGWTACLSGWMDSFIPTTGGDDWLNLPNLTDIFPWQQPGCKYGRTWPISPSPDLLERRWKKFTSAGRNEKPSLFVTAKSGRNCETKVAGLRRLADLGSGDSHQPMVRYGFRSFDRQWTFRDPRLAELERPSLWASASDKQIFLATFMTGKISAGPTLTVSAYVPDLHYFRGSFGGKDIIPLYRDRAATVPNLTVGFTKFLGKRLGMPEPSPEDVAAYVYSLTSSPTYYEYFAIALKTPGIRIPITSDKDLWKKAVDLGSLMLWLHTYAERFRNLSSARGKTLPIDNLIGWDVPITVPPKDLSEVIYEPDTSSLRVGDGKVVGVDQSVWDYSVSGMPVLKKWLGYRTIKGAGRATSSGSLLDAVRPDVWPDEWNDELLDLIRVLKVSVGKQAELAELFQESCDGKKIDASELPKPQPADRVVTDLSAPLFER